MAQLRLSKLNRFVFEEKWDISPGGEQLACCIDLHLYGAECPPPHTGPFKMSRENMFLSRQSPRTSTKASFLMAARDVNIPAVAVKYHALSIIHGTPFPPLICVVLFFEQKEEAPKKEENPFHVGPFWESKIFKEGG